MSSDLAIRNLSVALANSGEQPPTVDTNASLPYPEVSTAHVDFGNSANDVLTWSNSNVLQSGDNIDQLVFHEFDHFYYELGPYSPFGVLPNNASAVIGGVTYTWNLALVPAGMHSFNVSSGYLAYEHLLVYNDLIKTYGSDTTGALGEALKGAVNAPQGDAAVAKIVQKNGNNPISLNFRPKSVGAGQTCKKPVPTPGKSSLTTGTITVFPSDYVI